MNILEKNLLILASAGSGKTFQLGNRVIGLIAKGNKPERIVALTFTRKAAGEFADSVLNKLAAAASDEKAAAKLLDDIGLEKADFSETLEQVVRALPKFTLGTMDSFFAKVVRGFQYELGLTGGKFDLLEGPRAEAAADEMLDDILGQTLADEGGDEFLHAFRRATMGREEQKVQEGLREFVNEWQGRFRNSRDVEWGPVFLAGALLEDWERLKYDLAARAMRGLDDIEYTDKRQRATLEKVIETLSAHTIGSGSLGGATGLLASLFEAAQRPQTGLEVKFQKPFFIGGPTAEALREMVDLAARCELAAAVMRTRAVREVISAYDDLCENRLRKRGLLGFDDVKVLMGEWAKSEDARVRRDLVDFRLDARYDHWLLDEFQDTSGADWTGLEPLIDEAASEAESTVFIVGDRKQAIYAWRGGDVGLFGKVLSRYESHDLKTEPMDESWRSCPQVLELVNRVFGDGETLKNLFGDSSQSWLWQNHFSAEALTGSEKCGEARVELVEGKWDERLLRLGEILNDQEVGKRAMTCGVLVRSNDKVREVADHLRAEGFDVIEEGRREPAKDNPVGIAIGHLLKWLADPGDSFAKEVIEMSPFANVLRDRFGVSWQSAWEGLTGRAAETGFAGMVEELVEALWTGWSDFGKRRAGDLIAALAELDLQGAATAGDAADWIERLQVSQSPGVAAVQVMTIHKSKGLGFDMVIVPDVPTDSIPATQRFTVAEGPDWLTQTPPKWARDLLPEIHDAENRWAASQRYEAFCTLYVALTRAKRGLYVLLEPPAKSAVLDKPSLSNWLALSVGAAAEPGVVFQTGQPDWVKNFNLLDVRKTQDPAPVLSTGIPKRERTTPSGMKQKGSYASGSGARFGNEMHHLLETIGWLDEGPVFPENDLGKQARRLFDKPKLAELFTRNGKPVQLLREQPVEALIDEKWLSGVIDRLHVYRDALGLVECVEVIDFKTDAVENSQQLIERYAKQMAAYREVIERIYPGAKIGCLLVSTALGEILEM